MYHVSNDYNLSFLYPRIPNNFFTENGYEDSITPRVCFSESIEGSLIGISRNIIDEILFVYEPIFFGNEIIIPNDEVINKVPDASYTKEIWVLNKTEIKLIKAIEVVDSKFGGIYKFGDRKNEKGEIWHWEWVELSNERLKELGYPIFFS